MTDVICDTSIVIKWFHEKGEPEVNQARRLLAAHRAGLLTAWILDLTFYELGNVLLRALSWPASDVAAQLDDARAICAVLAPNPGDLRLAAQLAEQHELTFYDAVYAAAARSRGGTLVTAGEALLAAGLGEQPAAVAKRLGLTESL